MDKIHQLPAHEAHKIAAGEVVERPANVVKELLENALDAGATSITVYIEQGGKKLIRIVDNGCGMSRADAHMSIMHHATSKITTVDELQTLETFGFRGEALSSIASVSSMTLITKEEDTPEAYKLTIEHGTIIETGVTAAPTGTDICIKDLFSNVPARKKFLKSDDTERRAIVQLFQALCLDYPKINFKLYHNDTIVHNCPAVATMHQRIPQLFDAPMHTHMHAASTTDESLGLTIDAVFSDQQYTRYDRSSLYFFVNKRWVKNYKLSQALIKGYMGILPPNKYPAAVIALTLNTRDVDINIHPRKEEVQFLHPRALENALTSFIKKQLEMRLSSAIAPLKPDPVYTPTPVQPLFTPKPFTQAAPLTQPSIRPLPVFTPSSTKDVKPALVQEAEHQTKIHIKVPEQVPASTVLGQLHATYIIIETEEGLALVDQHAAHERILYEQFLYRFNEVATVQLLFPQVITLKEDDLALLEEYLYIFTEQGILLEQAHAQQLMVTSVPVPYKDQSIEDLVHQVISWIKEFSTLEKQQFIKKITEKLRAQMACKAAVKAGDILTHEKMQNLISTLVKTENRFTCPHGRPTHWNISLHEIQKVFKRI